MDFRARVAPRRFQSAWLGNRHTTFTLGFEDFGVSVVFVCVRQNVAIDFVGPAACVLYVLKLFVEVALLLAPHLQKRNSKDGELYLCNPELKQRKRFRG